VRIGRRLLVVLVTVIVAACGSQVTPSGPGASDAQPAQSNAQPGGSAQAGEPTDGLFTDADNPLNLTVAADRARSATATVTAEGGTVTATGTDGTTFALEIPKDAVYGAVDVTLTPTTDIKGWSVPPGNSAAVLMEPDGLTFATPARLVITPAHSIGNAQWAAFRFYGDGNDAHLLLPEAGSGGIAMPVEHFSGHGFAWNVSTPFFVALARYRQSQAEDRLQGRLAAEVARVQQQGAGANPTLEQVIDEIIPEWERDVLNRRLLLVSKSCADAQYAYIGFRAFNREMQLLGIPRHIDPPPRLFNLVRYICAEEATKLCFENGDVERLDWILLRDAKELAVQGLETGGDTAAYLEACARFDLRIEEHSQQDIAGYELMEADLSIAIPLRFEPYESGPTALTGQIVGEAKATFDGGKGTVATCKVTFAGASADVPFKAKLERIEYINTGVKADSIRLKDLKLDLYSGHLNVNATVRCPAGSSPYGSRDIPFFFARYKGANEGALKVSGWNVGSHPEMATKSMTRDGSVAGGTGNGKGSETLELTLVHTPGPMPPRPEIAVP
jgi:hypothetical protein